MSERPRDQGSPRNRPRDRPWFREPYVWLVIALPASAVIAGFVTLHLAVRSYDGPVVDDYYQQGLAINRDLRRDRAARDLDIRGELRLDREARRMRLSLAGVERFEPPATVRVRLLHATRSGVDRELIMPAAASGTYEAALPALAPGRWHLHVETERWRVSGQFRAPHAAGASLRGGG